MTFSWSPPTRIDITARIAQWLLPRARRIVVWCIESGATPATAEWNYRYRIDTPLNRRLWQEVVDAPTDEAWLRHPRAGLNESLHAERIVEVAAREEEEAFDRWLLSEARRLWKEGRD